MCKTENVDRIAGSFSSRKMTRRRRTCRRTAVIGTIEQYPTKGEALDAVNGLRMQINAERNRRPVHPLLIADLIDHYVQTELSPNADWHSRRKLCTGIHDEVDSAKLGKDGSWCQIEPWQFSIGSERTTASQRHPALANQNEAKIRNLFSVLFNHAIRYKWLEQGRTNDAFVEARSVRVPGSTGTQ